MSDIDQINHSAEILAVSESHFRMLVEYAPMGFSIMDRHQKFEYFNPKFKEILGYTIEDLPDKHTWFKRAYPDPDYRAQALDAWEKDARRVARTGEVARRTFKVRTRNGRDKMIRFSCVSLIQGKQMVSYEDLTSQQQAVTALAESEAKYQRLFEAVLDGIIVIDAETLCIEDVNQAALELFGYSKEEYLRLRVEDISAEKERSRETIRKTVNSTLAITYVPLRYFIKKDGTIFPGEVLATRFESGGLPKIIGSVRDITARMEALETLSVRERQLTESQQKLRRLTSSLLKAQEEERRRIAYALHDELGQDLATLNFRLSALETEIKNESPEIVAECREIRRDVGGIAENVRRLSRGMSPTVLENLGLTAALNWMLKDFTRHTQVKVTVEIDDIDHLFSSEAEVIIYRIFQEALTNVSKHANAGRVEVRIKRQGSKVNFNLHDDGCGFEPEAVAASPDRIKGLGLTTMEERARILGGPLVRTSRLGHGTSIEFTVPSEAKEPL